MDCKNGCQEAAMRNSQVCIDCAVEAHDDAVFSNHFDYDCNNLMETVHIFHDKETN